MPDPGSAAPPAGSGLQGNLLDQEDFLDLLGHELRNPLAPIHYAVHLIRNSGQDPKLLESACAIVERQVSNLAQLVEDLVDLSRIGRGKVQLPREPVDLVEAVRLAAAGCRAALEEKGLTLEVELPAAQVWLEGDPARLGQAVANLLLRTIQCADPGSPLSLAVQADPDGWGQVIVRDPGSGLLPEWLSSAIGPGVPGQKSGERSPSGLGLGLALARELVALHGGTVEAHSDEAGQGSELVIRLPRLKVAHQPPVQPAPAAAVHRRQARRILIVEDLLDAAITMELLLEMLGHTVEVATDGMAGLEKAGSFAPDIILCDIGLPGLLDGYDLARTIRSTPALARIHLIALTGFGTAEDKDRTMQAGFDQHLTKPVDPAALEPLIERIP